MPCGAQHELDDWQPRIKGVEREYQAVRFSTDRTQEEVRRDRTILRRQLEASLREKYPATTPMDED
jgi:hypothetical protein